MNTDVIEPDQAESSRNLIYDGETNKEEEGAKMYKQEERVEERPRSIV